MADRRSSRSNPCTRSFAERASGRFGRNAPRSSSAGFTLVELLVAFTVASTLLGIALSITLSSRRVMDTDERRIRTVAAGKGIEEINDLRNAA